MRHVLRAACVAAALFGAGSAHADQITYSLLARYDGAGFNGYGQTYQGNGFAGSYYDGSFAYIMGAADYAYTNAQVGIGNLAGSNILSATFSFHLTAVGSPGQMNFTGYDSNGTLSWLPIGTAAQYGTATGYLNNIPGTGATDASFDITSIVQAAVAAGEDWLGLLMYSAGQDGGFSYTTPNGDEAQVRLTIDYGPAAVPEPTSLVAFGAGLLALGLLRRRRAQ